MIGRELMSEEPRNGRSFDIVNGMMFYDGTYYHASGSGHRKNLGDPLVYGVEIGGNSVGAGGDNVRLFIPWPVARALLHQIRRLDHAVRDPSGKLPGDHYDQDSAKYFIGQDRAKVDERLNKAKQGITQALAAWQELSKDLDEWGYLQSDNDDDP
jgi:hypothetical protein